MHNKNDLLKTGIFLFIFFICILLFDFLLIPYTKLMGKFDKFRNYKLPIDFLITGSSLESEGIDKKLLEKELCVHSYILDMRSGCPQSEYILLLDTIPHFSFKTVIIGWDILQNLQNPYYPFPEEEDFYKQVFRDTKGNSVLRLVVLKKMMKFKYTMMIFPFASSKENLFRIPSVLESRQSHKFSPDEKDELIHDNELLTNKKFAFKEVVTQKYTNIPNPADIEYLSKIKSLCKKNNITLYAVCSPVPECDIKNISIFPEMQKATISLFHSLDIPVINTYDSSCFPDSTTDSNFKDCFGHISGPYRQVYTKCICSWIKKSDDIY